MELKYSMRVEWTPDDDVFVASCPELGDLSAHGDSYEEAVTELHVAIEAAIEVLAEDGMPIPPPREQHQHSGQTRIRMPKSLHARLSRQSVREGVSLNTLMVGYLAEVSSQTEVTDFISARTHRELASLKSAVQENTDRLQLNATNVQDSGFDMITMGATPDLRLVGGDS